MPKTPPAAANPIDDADAGAQAALQRAQDLAAQEADNYARVGHDNPIHEPPATEE